MHGFYRKLNDQNPQEKFIAALSGYEQRYKQSHGLIKLLGMTEPIEIESIFTTVNFLDQKASCSSDSIQTLETSSRQYHRHKLYAHDQPQKKAIDIVNQEQYLMVLGGPGTGKTTFLKKIGLEALKSDKGSLKHKCIPVFIKLKHIDPDKVEIEQNYRQGI